MQELSIKIKKQLGYIIRKKRKYLFSKTKKPKKCNPFSKTNFCKDICHYHTLTKLESDYVQDNLIYHKLLDKLNLKFNITEEKHNKNLNTLDQSLNELFTTIEYIDDEKVRELNQSLAELDYQQDCIAQIHFKLLKLEYNLHFIKKVNEAEVNEIKIYEDLFTDLYKALLYQTIGVYKLNKLDLNQAEFNLNKAKHIYDQYGLSKGVLQAHIISLYFIKQKYHDLINLCFDMESYYKETNNKNRLIYSYFYLTQVLLTINSKELANTYFNKTVKLIDENELLKRYETPVYYNYGLFCLKDYCFQDAIKYLILTSYKTENPAFKLKIVNTLLFIYNKKNYQHLFYKLIEETKDIYKEGEEVDQTVFRYFLYKYDKNPYYRKYAVNQVIPLLKSSPSRIDFLLMLYEDLYE